MTSNNINDITAQLVEDLQPVRRLDYPCKRFFKLVVVGVFVIIAMVFAYDIDGEVMVSRFSNIDYMIPLLLIVGAGMSLLLAAFKLSVPDEVYNKQGYFLAGGSAFLWGILYYLVLSSISVDMVIDELNHSVNDIYSICGFTIFGVTTASIAILMLKKAAPVNRGLASVSVLVGGFSFSIISCHLMHGAGGSHVFVWQLIPLLILAIVGFFVGRKLL